jgi:glycerol uptake facilitator-like aquaporin
VVTLVARYPRVAAPKRCEQWPVLDGFVVVAVGLIFGTTAGYATNPAREPARGCHADSRSRRSRKAPEINRAPAESP